MRELPAVTSSKVVEGALSLHYSCGGNHHHGGCQPSYSLSLRSGEVITLDLSETLQASLPPDKEINGRYVRLHLDSPKTEGINRVKSLSIVPESLRPKQFRDKWLGESPQPVLASLAPQLGSKPYVVILAKYKDNATEPHTRAYYDQLFGDVQPGLNHWFKQVSYGRMNINGSVIYGWVTLPKTYQEYLTSTGINFGNVINDACDQVDDQVDFLKIYGVNVMVNGQIGGPWGLGGGAVMTREGVQQVWGATLNMQPHAQNLMAHEMGHSLGLGHAGNEAGAEYGSVFDVMGNGAVGSNGIPYHAWHRNYLDWIKPSEVEIVWPG